jgi:hypothetical protein
LDENGVEHHIPGTDPKEPIPPNRAYDALKQHREQTKAQLEAIERDASAEVMAEEEAPSSGWGAIGDRASVGRAD